MAELNEAQIAALSRQDHSSRATVALQKLVEMDPAFGSLTLWCKHRDARPKEITVFTQAAEGASRTATLRYDLAPAYTDGETIWYGAKFADWTLDEQVAVCAHEIMHVACRHVTRGKSLANRLGASYNPALFNIATDAIINETLRRAGYKVPDGGVALTALWVDVLKKKWQDIQVALTELDAETLYHMLATAAEQSQSAANALDVLAGQTFGDLDARGAVTADALKDAEWATRLERALSAGARAGRGIGVHAHSLGDLPKSKTPWEVVLRCLVTKAVTRSPQPTFTRPSRRWLALASEAQKQMEESPAFEQGRINEKGLPRVAVCLDVSGSISPGLLRRFGGEISGISKRTGAELSLIVFDHGIQLDQRLKARELDKELADLNFKRGGGTSFVEPVEAAMAHDPSIIVMLTDLFGPFGVPPTAPVIWAVPRTGATAPFGKIVVLEN
ncbi:vWA domain-containing protein [Celeribacter sp. ULVN23_4]